MTSVESPVQPQPVVTTPETIPTVGVPNPAIAQASPEQQAQVQQTISEARQASSIASFEEMMAKPRRVLEFDVSVGSGGEVVQRKMVYRALNGEEYDALQASHPPTPKQKADGATWNTDTFPPALIAAVSHKPKLTVEQAKALWKHKDWSAGEQATLFMRALEVCQSGLSVPFSVSD